MVTGVASNIRLQITSTTTIRLAAGECHVGAYAEPESVRMGYLWSGAGGWMVRCVRCAATLFASSVRLYVLFYYSFFYILLCPIRFPVLFLLPTTSITASRHPDALLDVDIEQANWHPDTPLLYLLNSTHPQPPFAPLQHIGGDGTELP